MISIGDLRIRAEEKFVSSQRLLAAGQILDAFYFCGYPVEFLLKACIARRRGWPGWPESDAEWKSLNPGKTLKIHKLDDLLIASGLELQIKTKYLSDWSLVALWEPDVRYRAISSVKRADAEAAIAAVERLMKVIWNNS